ncbi:MAG: NPXTG-anchored protein [[Eubacterium] siraeum]
MQTALITLTHLAANVAGVPLINTWTPDAEILDDQAGNFASDIEVTFDVTGYDKAPADTDAPATDAPATDAPTTGDSTKPNTNTGVEGVAAVAGVALLAAGAVVVAKKRK